MYKALGFAHFRQLIFGFQRHDIGCTKDRLSKVCKSEGSTHLYNPHHLFVFLVPNKAFREHTWTNDKKHSWKQWRYGHSSLAVDGNADANLPNCAIMDNYYVDNPVWMVDLGKSVDANGVVVLTWQGSGQGN